MTRLCSQGKMTGQTWITRTFRAGGEISSTYIWSRRRADSQLKWGAIRNRVTELWAAKKPHMCTSTTLQPFPLHHIRAQSPLASKEAWMSESGANGPLMLCSECGGPDSSRTHTWSLLCDEGHKYSFVQCCFSLCSYLLLIYIVTKWHHPPPYTHRHTHTPHRETRQANSNI